MSDPELPELPPPHVLVRAGLVFYGLMAIAAVVWREGFDDQSLWILPGAGAPDIPRDLALGAAAGLAVAGLSQLITRVTGWGDRLGEALAESIGALSLPNALLLASASGLAEEMLFRGALQPNAGLIAASLLFGLVHFVPRRELLPWTGFAVVIGFGLGWLFQSTGNLIAPVVAHTLVNAINLPFLARRYPQGPESGPAG